MSTVQCQACGIEYGISCSPWCRDGHAPVVRTDAFHAGYDIGLGMDVSNLGDVRKAMREGKLDYRDRPTKGDNSARLDRAHAKKRARAQATR